MNRKYRRLPFLDLVPRTAPPEAAPASHADLAKDPPRRARKSERERRSEQLRGKMQCASSKSIVDRAAYPFAVTTALARTFSPARLLVYKAPPHDIDAYLTPASFDLCYAAIRKMKALRQSSHSGWINNGPVRTERGRMMHGSARADGLSLRRWRSGRRCGPHRPWKPR